MRATISCKMHSQGPLHVCKISCSASQGTRNTVVHTHVVHGVFLQSQIEINSPASARARAVTAEYVCSGRSENLMICSAAHPRYFNESASGRRHRPCSGFGFAIAVARSCPWCWKQAAAEHGDVPHVECQNKLMTLVSTAGVKLH
jgi:hypothetical protein